MIDLINFFTEGFCQATPENFLKSNVSNYLSRVYGDLIYTEKPTINFINVYKYLDSYLISDSLFCDKYPDLPKIGSILPLRNFIELENDERGGSSYLGYKLSTQGYFKTELDLPIEALNEATQDKYIPLNFVSGDWGHICDANKKIHFEPDEELIGQQELPNSSRIYGESFITMLKSHFKDNYIIQNLMDPDPFVQRMQKGDRIDMHIDPSPLGAFKPSFISSATWIPIGDVRGRYFQAAKRSIKDLKESIYKVINNSCKHEKDYSPQEYELLDKIKPTLGGTVVANDFNPFFCHGVSEMQGSGINYSFTINIEIKSNDYKGPCYASV